MPRPGTAFQLKGDRFHYRIVISTIKEGKVLVVNVTDEKGCIDQSCRIAPHEYSIIDKPSVIFFKRAIALDASKIDAELSSGAKIQRLPDCPPDLLQRILASAHKSEYLSDKLREYLV